MESKLQKLHEKLFVKNESVIRKLFNDKYLKCQIELKSDTFNTFRFKISHISSLGLVNSVEGIIKYNDTTLSNEDYYKINLPEFPVLNQYD